MMNLPASTWRCSPSSQHGVKQRHMLLHIGLILWLFCLGSLAHAHSPFDTDQARELLFNGPTPAVDPVFPYYQGRSPESIAEEIALRGYRAVHMVITSEKNVDEALIRAFHAEGIAVWGMVWAGGTYSTVGFPAEWPEWRQQLITPAAPDGFIYLSPYHPDYRIWKKAAVSELVRQYPLDGIELVEAFFPNWNGLQSGVYGDIGPHAREAFRQMYGEDPPNFTDTQSTSYYTKVPALYDKWVQFRVDSVTDWLDDLVNGPGGIRETRPDIPVSTWTLATNWPNSMEKARLDLGEDLSAVVQRVKPDIHFFQTNWPDWLQADLPADYARLYAPYVQALREIDPDLPIGIQADIGSQIQNRRDWDWITAFEEAAWDTGFSTHTMYEYHIALYMYTEPPSIMKVRRSGPTTFTLSFNKRIDWFTARSTDQFVVLNDGSDSEEHPSVNVTRVTADGNRLLIELSGPPEEMESELCIKVTGVRDAPMLRLLKQMPALTMEPQVVTVPAQP